MAKSRKHIIKFRYLADKKLFVTIIVLVILVAILELTGTTHLFRKPPAIQERSASPTSSKESAQTPSTPGDQTESENNNGSSNQSSEKTSNSREGEQKFDQGASR